MIGPFGQTASPPLGRLTTGSLTAGLHHLRMLHTRCQEES